MSCIGCGKSSNRKPNTIKYQTNKTMACVSCGSANEYNVGTCRVCQLVDQDERQKQVRWCQMCQAFICQACEGNGVRRIKAFGKTVAAYIELVARGWTG